MVSPVSEFLEDVSVGFVGFSTSLELEFVVVGDMLLEEEALTGVLWLVDAVSGDVALVDRSLFRFFAFVLSAVICAEKEFTVGCGVGIAL
ncbi:hypothetical protein [Bartonella saheliensis]|uniref:hypothetical protein n=1 Tax=Bartonella saheliensis TaxID=1457016 RepID=UPI001FE76788|nr:hypothetical protein [Bartonella saheliensis]